MKNYTAAFLVLTILTTLTIGVLASETDIFSGSKPVYGSFSGTIISIEESRYGDGSRFFSVRSGDESTANFIVNRDTYISKKAELEIGKKITGYYDLTKPMVLIYPPQYQIEVLLGEKDFSEGNVYLGYFNEELVSFDNSLKLNLSEETDLFNTDGSHYSGDVALRKLIVYYTISTRSIPAQTVPEKIIVLDKYYRDLDKDTVSHADIIIEDKVLKDQKIYKDSHGMVYAPLRIVGESLGYAVEWEDTEKKVTIAEKASLKIGSGICTDLSGNTKELRNIPALRNGTTYVPVSFFRDVMEINNAHFIDGKLVIHNRELYK